MHYGIIFSGLVANVEYIISHGGYSILAILTILEGVPVLGMLIPGHMSIISAGFLAKIGILNLSWIMLVSIIGSTIGDFIGFYIGRKYGMSFIDKIRRYFSISDLRIDKVRAIVNNHTGKAMIIGRFTPATRSLMPFVVGTMNIPSKRFWLFNIIGSVFWVVSSVMLGFFVGAGYHMVAGYLGRFFVFTLLISLILIWGYRFMNKHFHIFKRFELITLGLNIVSMLTFAIVVDKLSNQYFKLSFDVWLSRFMCDLVHPVNACLNIITPDSPLTPIGSVLVHSSKWISTVGGTTTMVALGMLAVLWYTYKKKWRSASIMLLSIGLTSVFVLFFKDLFSITRPDLALKIMFGDPSFPSGHASLSASFFLILGYLLAPKIQSWIKRELVLVLFAFIVIIIGVSRLVLNVHWFSDVIAGWSLGVFMATTSILLVRYVSVLFINKK